MNSKGQGVVETLLVLPLCLLVISCMGTLAYRSLVFHIAGYHLHEALICLESSPSHLCKTELETRLKKILLKKTRTEIQFSKQFSGNRGSVAVQLTPSLKIEQTLGKIR